MERVTFDSNRVPHCPKCVSKQPHPDNRWCYGSPIKHCPSCGTEYFDERYREIAIDGYIPNTLSPKRSLIIVAISAAFVLFAIVMYLYETHSNRGYYHIVEIPIAIGGTATFLLGIADFISIVTGSKQKKLERLKAQSEERMQNPDYVQKLAEVGVNVHKQN